MIGWTIFRAYGSSTEAKAFAWREFVILCASSRCLPPGGEIAYSMAVLAALWPDRDGWP